jgi:hypothetical protein
MVKMLAAMLGRKAAKHSCEHFYSSFFSLNIRLSLYRGGGGIYLSLLNFFVFLPVQIHDLAASSSHGRKLVLASYTIHTLHFWIYIKFKVGSGTYSTLSWGLLYFTQFSTRFLCDLKRSDFNYDRAGDSNPIPPEWVCDGTTEPPPLRC